MSELQKGWIVQVKGGSSCRVVGELGRGGQGIVYKVKFNNKDYALKWYTKSCSDAFYNNLEKNVNAGAPNKGFLWPLAITEKQNGCFGYIMDLRPNGYEDMSKFILAKARFASVDAQLNACLRIVKAFLDLHRRGYSYQDLNDGNFFIHPKTGDVLICDNDNVAPHGQNLGILGKAGYMAPEIVEGVGRPDTYSDYYSLAVCLFILIYMNRPFEGKKYLSCPCDNDPKYAKELFGFNSVFIMDPDNRVNAPDEHLHKNVIRRWDIYPKQLQDAFCKTFSSEAIRNKQKRVSEREWKDILLQVRSMLSLCPSCKKKTFVDPADVGKKCVYCKKTIPAYSFLEIGRFKIPLLSGQNLFGCITFGTADNFDEVVGTVLERNGQVGLLNQSNTPWTVTCTNGEDKLLSPQKSMPARQGYVIRFGNQGGSGEIKITK